MSWLILHAGRGMDCLQDASILTPWARGWIPITASTGIKPTQPPASDMIWPRKLPFAACKLIALQLLSH